MRPWRSTGAVLPMLVLCGALCSGALCPAAAQSEVAPRRKVPSAPNAGGPVGVESVPVVGMTVAEMDRSIAFYRDVLTFRVVSDVEVSGDAFEHLSGVFGGRARVVRLRLADESLELTQYLTRGGRPIPADSRSNDAWFQHVAIIVADMDSTYRRLRAHHVEHASTGPQRLPDWNPNAGGIRAFYFKDPDQHVLEVLQFPKEKGLARWHRNSGDTLFLGIDHTAIVARDTDVSLAFYRDVLGMVVAGSSENFGTEQEHLNNVFGARLRITALRAATGPGIELLEYLSPRDGRPAPSDARSNDIGHWETTLTVRSAATAAERLRRAGTPLVSSGVIALAAESLGVSKAFLVRDPDGHVLRLAEPR